MILRILKRITEGIFTSISGRLFKGILKKNRINWLSRIPMEFPKQSLNKITRALFVGFTNKLTSEFPNKLLNKLQTNFQMYTNLYKFS